MLFVAVFSLTAFNMFSSFFINLFICLFIYFWLCWVFVAAHGFFLVVVSGGYSSLRCMGFSLQWLLLLQSMGSRRMDFSSRGIWAQQLWLTGSRAQAQQLWHMGLVVPWHMGSSRTRARTRVPCIGRRILNHCAKREVPNIFSLCLIFVSLISIWFGMFLFGFMLYGTLCASWTWVAISFPMLWKFLALIFLNYFLRPFLLLFFFWDPYNSNVGVFNVVPEVSEAVLISFHSLFFILFHSRDFHRSVFQLTYSFFGLSYSAIDSFQSIFHFSYFIVYLCLFVLQFLQVFVNHFLYPLDPYLHSFFEVLDHLYYHYSELFFRQSAYLLFIQLFLQSFILLFHLQHFFIISFCETYCVVSLAQAAGL